MRQYAGFSDADESNQRYRYLLDQGTERTLRRLRSADADRLRQRSRDGARRGRPRRRADRLDRRHARLFAGIPLDRVTTSMTINATAAILLALYLALAEEQGVPLGEPRAAPSRTTSSRSTSRAARTSIPPAPSMRLVTDVISFCAEQVPHWNHDLDQRLPHARGRLDRRAGDRLHARARPRLRRRGARPRAWPSTISRPRLSFFFNAHNNLLEEVAKFRAARRLWARATARALRRRKTSAHSGCASIPRPPARRSPRSSRTTTSCGSRSRPWPR